MATDESLSYFHERDLRVLVPSDEKRVGTAAKFDEKEGYTLMVTVGLLFSSLLCPFIIFTGKFSRNLKKQWQTYSEIL